MSQCPCCSKLDYESCCGPYHQKHRLPKTPEALMRSRYCAYVLSNMEYIQKTMQGKPLDEFNAQEAKNWAFGIKWLKLIIKNSYNTSPKQGYVEFIARFIENGQHRNLHEISEFHWINGQWFYVDGVTPEIQE